MPLRLFDLPLAVVDVETTGASVDYGDRVIEIGIVRVEQGRVVAAYERLVNPQRRISAGASFITGITTEMVADQPLFCDVWSQAKALLDDAVIIGHNVQFDLAFLTGECLRFGCALCDALGDAPVLDTVRIARKQLGRRGNALQKLASRLQIEPDAAHRALADCRTTLAVLEKLLAPHGGWDMTLEQAHALQGRTLSLSQMRPRASRIPDAITHAMLQQTAVQITYLDTANIRTTRAVSPRHVRRVNGHLTLIGHCHLSNALRSFRLTRILHTSAIDEGSQLPDE